jgi:dihydrofolate reductase
MRELFARTYATKYSVEQERGKNILIGGVSIPSQLIEFGLIDEYRLGGLISQSPEQCAGKVQRS